MLINGIDTEIYNATLLDRHIENAEIITNVEWSDNWIEPIIEDQYIKYSLVHCEFEISCFTDDEAEKSISKLLSLGRIGELIFEDLDLKYHGFIESKSDEKITRGKYLLNVTWKCRLGYEDEVTQSLTAGSNTITLESTADTPVIIEIMPTSNIAEIEIKGFGEDIVLRNLTSGKKIAIDGEKGLVSEEGENKYTDYEAWGFPKLHPGENNIVTDIPLTIKYSPRWL